MNSADDTEDDWTLWWDARLAALESILGKSHDTVSHGTIPFNLGADLGGAADISAEIEWDRAPTLTSCSSP